MPEIQFFTPILLLSGTMPGDNGVGDIYLSSLLDHLRNPNVHIAHVSERNHYNLRPDINGRVYCGFRSAYSRFRHLPRWCGVLLETAKELLIQFTDENRVAREITEFAQLQNVEFVWAVLDSPPMFRIARKVATELKVPLVVTVWDPPSGVSRLYVRNTLVRFLDRQGFVKTMAIASGAAVISDRMADEYAAKFRIPVAIVRYGLSPCHAQSVNACLPVADEIRIAFCGSVYAAEEWAALLAALDSFDWKCNGVPVRLLVATRELPRIKVTGPANITLLGWRSSADVEALLQTCHVGYLPYWFSQEYSESVRLCFATKLSNYLAAGLPVLYHGPRSSAVADFVDRYQLGVCCGSLDRTGIMHAIAALTDTEERLKFSVGIRLAVQQELNSDVFLSRFCSLLSSTGLYMADHSGNQL
jgi:hypothetical protein